MVVAFSFGACGDDHPVPEASPDPLDSLDVADEGRLKSLEREANREGESTAARLLAALEGAQLAERLAEREGASARTLRARARRLLEQAADEWSVEGSCEALARLAVFHTRQGDAIGENVARARGQLRSCPGAWTRAASGPTAQRARQAESVCRLVGIRLQATGAEAARAVLTLAPGALREGCSFEEHREPATPRPDDATSSARGEDALGGQLSLRIEGLRVRPGIGPVRGVGPIDAVSTDGAEIVIDLASRARAHTFYQLDPLRLVVDARSDPVTPTTGPLVVLDPGHGGEETGARFADLEEADVVLDLAKRVRSVIRQRAPSVRVVLTRTEDTRLALDERAAQANALDADVFVSLHLNAADEPVRIGGITTFVLDTTDDRQAIRLAARENGTSAARVSELQRLLAGLHRRDQLAGSRALAERLHAATLAGGRQVLADLPDRGVRSALFYVLVGARMPAVLLEASFLTKPEEAAALHTPIYRQALARGIAVGLIGYLSEVAERSQ